MLAATKFDTAPLKPDICVVGIIPVILAATKFDTAPLKPVT